MKFEIELSEGDFKDMQKNKYAYDGRLTTDTMLDILHNIVDQIMEHR